MTVKEAWTRELRDVHLTDEVERLRHDIERHLAITTEQQAEIARLQAQRDQLADALRGLVDRLDDVHIDPAYKAVWEIHQLHAGPYAGPTYVADLEKARAAVAAVEGKP